jgi:hypothetical protein
VHPWAPTLTRIIPVCVTAMIAGFTVYVRNSLAGFVIHGIGPARAGQKARLAAFEAMGSGRAGRTVGRNSGEIEATEQRLELFAT